MGRGPKKHLKRVASPSSWMLFKMGGKYAPKTSAGPHKAKESVPLCVVLRHRLKYASTGREVTMIVKDKEGLIKVDHRVRTDPNFPLGIMDVLTIDKTNENFRILYDVKGRFILRKINQEEAAYKLVKVVRKELGANKIPYVVTNDSRTLRFPHPDINLHDTLKLDIDSKKVLDVAKFEVGNLCYVISGNNIGRVGVLTHIESHLNSHEIVHLKDEANKKFATRQENVMIIGKGLKPLISLSKDKGLSLSNLEEKEKKENQKNKAAK